MQGDARLRRGSAQGSIQEALTVPARLGAPRLLPSYALIGLESPDGPAGGTLLGEDLHDASGGFGAIERRGRGSLDDLHALDGRGVDVTDHAGLSGGSSAPVRGRGLPDAVDVHERVADQREARVSPQSDRLTRPHVGGPRGNDDAGRAALEHGLQGLHWLRDIRSLDLRDRIAHLASPRLPYRAGHHDFVERQRNLNHLQGRLHGLVGEHVNRGGGESVADTGRLQLMTPRRHAGERE